MCRDSRVCACVHRVQLHLHSTRGFSHDLETTSLPSTCSSVLFSPPGPARAAAGAAARGGPGRRPATASARERCQLRHMHIACPCAHSTRARACARTLTHRARAHRDDTRIREKELYTSQKNVNAEGTTERAPVPGERALKPRVHPLARRAPSSELPRNPEGTFRAYIRGGPPGIYPCVPPHSSQIYASLARQSETAATGLAVRSPLSSTVSRAHPCPHRRADSYLLEPFRSTCSVSASGQGREG